MSDELALRAAVACAPLERTPRLVYADWLDEHDRPLDGALQRILAEPERDDHRSAYADVCTRIGDGPRAEFVRVQLALANLTPPHQFWPTQIEFDPQDHLCGDHTEGTRPGPRRARVLVGYERFAADPRTVKIGDVIDLVGPVAAAACEQSAELLGARVVGSVVDVEHAGAIKFDVVWGTDHYTDRAELNDLRVRERALMGGPGWEQLLPGPWALAFSNVEHVRAVSGSVLAAGARRGFITMVSGPASEWLVHGDAICARHPVEVVRLRTLPNIEADDHGTAFEARLLGRPRWRSFDKARAVTIQQVVLELLASEWPGVTFEFAGN
ncbi:hypothetical protein VT84_24850 [Gemmata sp. SH-PL17]|uniref:TIGR02996 domain-containing protein n=1 Tax=Gemmata sp. SH-PL17 TaxID=1630693 RepID=UPI0004ADD66E|nr:TIGR02996 domain-containing protein [Gemmata sp. SH-PL17]AMV27653.1 hypothetical protein VT84_24850 [Gemmata sp. SH-PL17]